MKHKRSWAAIIGAAITTLVLLGALAAGYWKYANTLPPFQPPVVTLPEPNASRDFAAARRLIKGAPDGGAPEYERKSLVALRADVARMRPGLSSLRRGLAKPFHQAFPATVDDPRPDLAHFRHLARCLVAEGKLAEREGRDRDAVRSYLDCSRLGAKIRSGGTRLDEIVGRGVDAIGLRPLYGLSNRLDASTAAWAARELISIEDERPHLSEIFVKEREFLVLWLYQTLSEREGWRRLCPAGSSSHWAEERWDEFCFLNTPKVTLVDHVRRHMDEVISASHRPYYEGPLVKPVGEPSWCDVVSSNQETRLRRAEQQALERVLRVRLAVRAFEIWEGKPAPTLQALVPRYLPAVPLDPFAPAPLVYRVSGGKPLVYSVGPDGDDDGGRQERVPLHGVWNGDLRAPLRRG